MQTRRRTYGNPPGYGYRPDPCDVSDAEEREAVQRAAPRRRGGAGLEGHQSRTCGHRVPRVSAVNICSENMNYITNVKSLVQQPI